MSFEVQGLVMRHASWIEEGPVLQPCLLSLRELDLTASVLTSEQAENYRSFGEACAGSLTRLVLVCPWLRVATSGEFQGVNPMSGLLSAATRLQCLEVKQGAFLRALIKSCVWLAVEVANSSEGIRRRNPSDSRGT